jgi:hypothetical protein
MEDSSIERARSILAKHYLDYSPEKLREIYEKANLKVLKMNRAK